jgi:hypothetical chaperone protein
LQNQLDTPLNAITECARQCVAAAGLAHPSTLYLTGGSSALSPLVDKLQTAFPQTQVVHGDRFGGVTNGLAWAAAHFMRVAS